MIGLNRSEIEFKGIFVTQLNIDFKEICDTKTQELTMPEWGEMKFDFEIYSVNEELNEVKIDFLLEHKSLENVTGFDFKISTTSFFNLNSIERKDRDANILYACLPIILGNIRGLFQTYLANFPLGRLDIPLFDLKDMVEASIKKLSNSELKK